MKILIISKWIYNSSDDVRDNKLSIIFMQIKNIFYIS